MCDDVERYMPRPVQILHMVREPADIIVSAYLYHTQKPAAEKWIDEPNMVPCAMDDENTAAMAALAGVKVEKLQKIADQCRDLWTKANNGRIEEPWPSYGEGLARLSTQEGLFVQATQN